MENNKNERLTETKLTGCDSSNGDNIGEITFKRFCPYCGNEVIQSGRGRPRKFCCERCLRLWQNKNQCPPLRKTAVKRNCLVCGKEFLTDRLNSRPKKYCSRACANRGRKLKAVDGVTGDEKSNTENKTKDS